LAARRRPRLVRARRGRRARPGHDLRPLSVRRLGRADLRAGDDDALLLYAYATGERSSRRIEARCRRDIAYRIITAKDVEGREPTRERFSNDQGGVVGS
jgi:hypothetical protein